MKNKSMTTRSFNIIAALIILLCGVNSVFAQCGADGKPPCNPILKKTAPEKTMDTENLRTTLNNRPR